MFHAAMKHQSITQYCTCSASVFAAIGQCVMETVCVSPKMLPDQLCGLGTRSDVTGCQQYWQKYEMYEMTLMI